MVSPVSSTNTKNNRSGTRNESRPKVADPVAGWRDSITSRPGARSSPGGIGSTDHKGLDIGKPTGTPIQAVKDGKVVFAGNAGGYGNLVVIEHPDGTFTKYAHQSAINVQQGAEVQAGDVIGKVGSTGNSTGPHLHFEVRKGDWNNGPVLDPVAYLEGAENVKAIDPGPGQSYASGGGGDSNALSGGGSPSSMGLSGGGSSGGAGGASGGGSAGGSSGTMSDILRKQDEERKRKEAERRQAAGDKSVTIPAVGKKGTAAGVKKVINAVQNDPVIQEAFKNWDKLTTDQKLEIGQRISEHMGEAFGFKPVKDIKLDPNLAQPGQRGTYGLWTSNGQISISEAALSSPSTFLNVITHEQAHELEDQENSASKSHKDGDRVYEIGDEIEEGVFGTVLAH